MNSSLILLALVAVALGVPAPTTKDFFWFTTDDGRVVPAFTKNNPKQEPFVPADSVKFYLYTKRNPTTPDLLVPFSDASLEGSNYISGAPLKVVVHGFSSSSNSPVGQDSKDAYLSLSNDINVIVVDWSILAAAPWYETAAGNTRPTGEFLGNLLTFLVSRGVASYSNIHILGHSLGSHVAGFAQSTMNGNKPARITAWDPALPLFGEATDEGRIDPTDATFVDVIHTAGGTLLEGALAFIDPRGHVDFYPNSGRPSMPGCEGEFMGTCSHSRAYQYHIESITRPVSFATCECQSWEHYLGSCSCASTTVMGEGTPSSARGLHYLRTNANPPYSQ